MKYGYAKLVSGGTELNTLRQLQEIFDMFIKSKQIVSNNKTLFTSEEFRKFCSKHQIRHIRLLAYYFTTTVESDRFAQVFKRALRA